MSEQIGEDEMGGICSTQREIRNACKTFIR